MKTLKLAILVMFLIFFNLPSVAQSSLKNAFYLAPFSFNLPVNDFGYSTETQSVSLNSVGFGFGLGYIFYFTDPDVVNIGADVTFAELDVNFNRISLPDHDGMINSTMLGMKLGPVLTFVPEDKFGIDLYCQLMFGISRFDYNHQGVINNVTAIPQYRLAPGMRFGYNLIYLNFEYNWGRPTVKETGAGAHIRELKINQSFFRFALCIKFSAFE